ncbi:hypothetical protein M3Y95_00719300 [Aphelenchoides besseyi]|nr:hypothetical protein M3Y95_00719300 [Aphelenchoides besseyi]
MKLWTILFLTLIFTNEVRLASSVICQLCDSFEEQCTIYSSCVGVACIKREAFINGMIRTQRLCLMDNDNTIVEMCGSSILWKNKYGTECICQTDYCNHNSRSTPFKLVQLLFITTIAMFLIKI